MKKKHVHKHGYKDDAVEKLKDWQAHQYNPGYYTGGNMSPVTEAEVNALRNINGWVYLVVSILILGIVCIRFYIQREDILSDGSAIFRVLIVFSLSILAIVGSILKIRSQKRQRFNQERK